MCLEISDKGCGNYPGSFTAWHCLVILVCPNDAKTNYLETIKMMELPQDAESQISERIKEIKDENKPVQLCGSLDCCKDKNCKLCNGSGFILPKRAYEDEICNV